MSEDKKAHPDLKKVLLVATIPLSHKAFSLNYMRHLRAGGYEVEAAAGKGAEIDFITREGFVYHEVDIPRGINFIKDYKAVKKLKKLLEDREIESFVVGLPIREDGDIDEKGAQVLKYVDSLSQFFEREVHTWDERYTTAIAEQSLLADNISRSGRKDVVDKIAAQLILQSYLDHVNRESGPADSN